MEDEGQKEHSRKWRQTHELTEQRMASSSSSQSRGPIYFKNNSETI